MLKEQEEQEPKEHKGLKEILEPMAVQPGPFPFFQIIQNSPTPWGPKALPSDCTD